MSTPEVPQSEANNPTMAKLYIGLSLLIALIGTGLAFLPWGYGFVTGFVAVPGIIISGKAARQGLPRAGRWASRANMLPVIIYIGYMVSYLPEDHAMHVFQATVLESGVLADQSVFDEKVQAAGDIAGLRLSVEPCGHEFVFRVTGKANNHLGVYVPSRPTRECLAQLQIGSTLELQVRSTTRALTGDTKGYKITRLGPCEIKDVDMGAVVKGTTCPSWF
jgi:hypothetical protein